MFVEVVSYTKKIKGATVLDDVSCSFEKGRVYGLKGKNGSGKTMLMRAIAGLIFPSSGTVHVGGKLLGKDISFPESMGLLIEEPSFIKKYTGMKNLRLLAYLSGRIGDAEIADAITKAGLDPADKRTYRKYSLGMKQRLAIACAIMENPELILLDEPINALDPSGVECVKAILQEKKRAGSLVIVACHDNEELHILADEILTLAEGRIVDRETVDRETALA